MNAWRPRRRQAGTWLALMLLVLRLAAPAPLMPAGALAGEAGAGLLAEAAICHADAGAPGLGPGPAGKPSVPLHDCALCPVCQLAATPALMPAAPWVSAPLQAAPARVGPPPSTGPPLPARYAAPPRGPPASAV